MADEINAIKEVRQVDEAVIVALQGDIDLHRTDEVQQALATACDNQPTRIVVNMRNVRYIDSSGIGALVEAFRHARTFGVKLLLCCANDRVCSVLEITKLNNVLTMYPTETEALTH